jgi:succinyl-CoA:acetate CoA-transferase
LIKNGMTVGMGGFTRAGEAKAVPQALIERAKAAALKINLITGDIIATMCVGSLKG